MNTAQSENQSPIPQNSPASLASASFANRTLARDAESLLTIGSAKEQCSLLHSVVLEFRQAHNLTPNGPPEARLAAISEYSIETASPGVQEAIRTLSSPGHYANLRHGGRATTPYPPLDDSALLRTCQEISAALVWQSSKRTPLAVAE